MRNTVEDKDKLAEKLDETDMQVIQDAIQETEDWLDSNMDAKKEDLDDKQRDLQSVCDPIIAQIYEN